MGGRQGPDSVSTRNPLNPLPDPIPLIIRFPIGEVIDKEPVAGPTGGALHSHVTAPGPIYLQGDHTAVPYRNLSHRPIRR